MKIKKKDIYFLGGVLIFALFMYVVQEVNQSSLIKKYITDEYEAIILDRFTIKDWSDDDKQIKILKQNGRIKNFPMRSKIMDFIEVGDSLIKIKDENLIYVVKPDGERKSFYYRRISMKDRNHWTFPEEWKHKWMESSAWDTIRKR